MQDEPQGLNALAQKFEKLRQHLGIFIEETKASQDKVNKVVAEFAIELESFRNTIAVRKEGSSKPLKNEFEDKENIPSTRRGQTKLSKRKVLQEMPEMKPKHYRQSSSPYIHSARDGDKEDLKGFECSECRDFYNLMDLNGQVDIKGMSSTICDHISRHRFLYEPPKTPEGLWDLHMNDS